MKTIRKLIYALANRLFAYREYCPTCDGVVSYDNGADGGELWAVCTQCNWRQKRG